MESLRPDCAFAFQRERHKSEGTEYSGTLSPVRLENKIRRIAAISRDFQDSAARFLCSSDYMAERGGFELSVRFRNGV